MSSNGISGHNHTSFTVSNRERSVAFYTNVLGFAIDRVYELQGKAIEQIVALSNAQLKMAHLPLGGGRQELIEYLEPKGQQPEIPTCNVGVAHMTFNTDNIQETYEALEVQRVVFKGEPMRATPDRPLACYFVNPAGITLELNEMSPVTR
jgi:catechol 2,3-dioxygenase-like lactoylglutathione lyase family enzyme